MGCAVESRLLESPAVASDDVQPLDNGRFHPGVWTEDETTAGDWMQRIRSICRLREIACITVRTPGPFPCHIVTLRPKSSHQSHHRPITLSHTYTQPDSSPMHIPAPTQPEHAMSTRGCCL
eukprot:GFYU01012518.1.p1 GENE.GFYU01012518.1~~GFYU01012518.1.p1  ORF type:complete len:121 (+),score=3.12 GFYU01012518.1:3-365(+)